MRYCIFIEKLQNSRSPFLASGGFSPPNPQWPPAAGDPDFANPHPHWKILTTPLARYHRKLQKATSHNLAKKIGTNFE